ncbi:MAG TPA: AI-2E family transporter [Candidatus Paceibacterota bacterium]|nr:AI-2E family transporter [Candidatus Paceibacterota bacterium]
MDKNVSITITTGTIIKIILIGVAAYALWILRDLALLVLTAIVIASAIEPGVDFFTKRRVPRTLAVAFMYLAVLGTVFGIIYAFLPPVLDDVQSFLSSAPQYLTTLNIPEPLTSLAGPEALKEGESQTQSLLDTVFAFRSAFYDTSGGIVQIVSAFFGGVFSFFLVVTLSFYFALRNTGVEEFLRIVTPKKNEEYVVGLWHRAQRKIGQWMQGQLILSLIISVIVYLGLLLCGVPYALLLALLAALFNIIPIFGSIIAGVIATVVAFGAGGLTLALIVAALFFIVNQFEGNLIYPLIVDKVVGIPPLLVIIALIAGGTLAGFLGILLSVPLAAAFREFIADVDKNKHLKATGAS